MFGFSGRKDDKSKQQKRGQGRKGGNLSQVSERKTVMELVLKNDFERDVLCFRLLI